MTVGRMALNRSASRESGTCSFKRVVLFHDRTGLRKTLPGNNLRM